MNKGNLEIALQLLKKHLSSSIEGLPLPIETINATISNITYQSSPMIVLKTTYLNKPNKDVSIEYIVTVIVMLYW